MYILPIYQRSVILVAEILQEVEVSTTESMADAKVNVLASHHYGPGLIPGADMSSGLRIMKK